MAISMPSDPLGTFVGNTTAAREWQDRGARYIATSFEAVLKPAMAEYLKTVRS